MQRRNIGSNTIVFISWIAVLAFPVVFAKAGFALLPDWMDYIGIAAKVMGIGVRQWAIAVLGRCFSGIIGVQAEHKVV